MQMHRDVANAHQPVINIALRSFFASRDARSLLQRILDCVSGGEGTVRIDTEIGGFEEERTYPRSKDPRKSAG